MTFSEFGRRIAENGNGGTDHGAAAPMFLAGEGVNGGIPGSPPALADDPPADVPFALDLRRVYAALPQEWLLVDPAPVVGDIFQPLGIAQLGAPRAAGHAAVP